MSLSIYKFIAHYISKSKLAQIVRGWTPNLLVWGSNPLGSNLFGEVHCSGDVVAHLTSTVARWLRWPALTRRYIEEKSPISRQNRRYIAINRRFLEIYPEKSSGRYFCKKNRVDTLRHTIFRRYIAEISRHFPPWVEVGKLTFEYIDPKGTIMKIVV